MERFLNKVTCGDCYELIKELPDKSVDLIVTDPPYLLETEGGNTSIGVEFKKIKDDLDKIAEGIDYRILDEYMRVMKKPNIYIWCNKKQILEYMKYFVEKHDCSFEIMTWIKTNPLPLCGGNYLIDKEFCLYFRKGVKLNTTFLTAFTYWQTPINQKDKEMFLHPTCKPLKIIKMLIKNSSNENDIVLDTFMGSGTTAVACKELNRNFVGFEVEPKWCEVANNRLNGITASGQMSIFLR